MGVCAVTLRYCDIVGDEAATTWSEARADLIVEGLPVRLPPTYQGQRRYPGLFWAATTRRALVYESLRELDRLWLADFDPTVVGTATSAENAIRGRTSVVTSRRRSAAAPAGPRELSIISGCAGRRC